MSAFADYIRSCARNGNVEAKVLGVGASPRKGGNSDVLLQHIVRGVSKNGMFAGSLQLRDYRYGGCIGCERCRKDKICTGLKDGMTLIYPEVIESRGLILVSPTHNYNVTAWMKAFIDRLYCFYHFEDSRPRQWSSRLSGEGRKAVLAAVCEQEKAADMGFTLDAMRLPIEALGYEIVGELPVLGIFDKAKVKEKATVLAEAAALGAKLAESLMQ